MKTGSVYLQGKDLHLRVSRRPNPSGCQYEIAVNNYQGDLITSDARSADVHAFVMKLLLLIKLEDQ